MKYKDLEYNDNENYIYNINNKFDLNIKNI